MSSFSQGVEIDLERALEEFERTRDEIMEENRERISTGPSMIFPKTRPTRTFKEKHIEYFIEAQRWTIMPFNQKRLLKITILGKYNRTTVLDKERKLLGPKEGDKIAWHYENGKIIVTNPKESE